MQDGNLLKRLRKENNLSESEMAKIIGVTLKSYGLYESGMRPMSLEKLNLLSNYFKISFNTLLGLGTQKNYYTHQDIDYKYLRFSLKYIRRINKVTITDLAKEFRIAYHTIINYEKGKSIPNSTYLYLFSKRFNVSVDYLLGKTLKKEVC